MMEPGEWVRLTIADCCEILDSKRIPINAEDRAKRVGDIPYFGANGLQGYIDDFIFNEPLILMAEDGGRFDEYSSRPIAYRITGKSWVNNHAHVLRAKAGYCQDAIFYSLEHKDIQSFIVGGTRSKLNQGALKRIEIYLPRSVDEQRAMACVISSVDHALAQAEAFIAKQERIKSGLMRDLLTRGVDENGDVRAEGTHKFKDSALGRIPVEWDVRHMDSLVDEPITYGIVQAGPHIDGGVPYIRTGDMADEGIDVNKLLRTSRRIANSYKRSEVRTGDIVFALRATVGKVLPVTESIDGANLTQGTAKISPSFSVDPVYLLWALRTSAVQRQIRLHQKGTTFAEITLGDLRHVEVAMPTCTKEQARISEILSRHEALSTSYRSQLRKIQSLRVGLMQDLLTGRRRVTSLFNDSSLEKVA
jgi:type I restriction enzyme S subunit